MPGARLWALICLGLTVACNIDAYRLEFDGDGGVRDARPRFDSGIFTGDADPNFGRDGGNPGGTDGGNGCVGEAERCNEVDDDCDGVVDNGFNLQLDPANCGRCGNACDDGATNQRGSCIAGTCVYSCLAGFLDCSDTVAGCEYPCIKTNGGEEACDGVDNDCDCQTDEGFATQSDVNNCGRCRNVCVALHGTPKCTAGVCGIERCDDGFKDLDPNVNGCEYRCPFFPPRASDATCDGLDDDCDGVADEDVPGVGSPCTTTAMGECRPGTSRCVNGQQQCLSNVGATPEVCDNKDNDCNGQIDNGFDKQNDPNNCGASCARCSFPHAIPGCQGGVCRYIACEPGWSDRFPDGQFPDMPGCDYQCTPSGPEVCDGIDNDCDGKTDNDDPDLIRPAATFCASRGACTGATLACGRPAAGCGDDTVAWRCVYGAGAEVDACGNLLPQETKCDDVDGDCDNVPDDAFPNKDKPCGSGTGICRDGGTFECNAAQNGTECVITSPGQPSRAETCNNLDDDCDGTVDDGATDSMVMIDPPGSAPAFWIDRYEASRPDATSTSEGGAAHRACSNPGVLPWSLVTWTQARDACLAAGKRLCTVAEWGFACEGTGNTTYPYGNTYAATTCNGKDFDGVAGGSDNDVSLPTGQMSNCRSFAGQGGIYDLSGNLREWTSTVVATSLRQIKGGAYDNIAPALTCDFDFWKQSPDSFFYNLGFRCCRTP